MNILILGGGGREHSLAWAVLQNPKCDRLIVAPGNAGIAAIADCATLDILDGGAVASFVEEEAIDFVIIGPEAPLAAGVADRLRDAGVLVFGPSKAATELEASKAFTKQICDAANAPTAAYGHFTDAKAAKAYVQAQGAPIVIKADGLAAGKGVIIAESVAQRQQTSQLNAAQLRALNNSNLTNTPTSLQQQNQSLSKSFGTPSPSNTSHKQLSHPSQSTNTKE